MSTLQPSSIVVADVSYTKHRIVIDDEETGLTAEGAEAIRQVLRALREGRSVDFIESAEFLTTQQAADLLGVSRPTLVKMLDKGVIPFSRPGKHRRVRREDVDAFLGSRRHRRSQALKDLHAAEESERTVPSQGFVSTR